MQRTRKTEVLIVGAGVMGTAAALELARRGKRVLVLERFGPNHSRGSSHGDTRIFRLSYPDPEFVALAREAQADWARLERDARAELLTFRGGLDIGPGAIDCAQAMSDAGVEFEELSERQVTERFGLSIEAGSPAVFQAETGILAARKIIEAQRELAGYAGAEFEFEARVSSISQDPSGITAVVSEDVIEAEHVVLAAGPWMKALAGDFGLELPLDVTVEHVVYLDSHVEAPVVIDWEDPPIYLVPRAFGAPGHKAGIHGMGLSVDPEDGPFEPIRTVATVVGQWAEKLIGSQVEVVSMETCLYTNAPSEAFIFGSHGRAIFLSACSGHGFKFAPRIARAVADSVDGLEIELPGRILMDLNAYLRVH